MDPVNDYFSAEAAESLLFMAVGAVALGLAAWFWWRQRQPYWRGMAVSLAAVALIQLVVGSTIWLRSPQDMARVHRLVAERSERLQTEEIPRMQQVMRNFEVYRWLEIGLLAVGLLSAWRAPRHSAWRGAGLGLALQAGFMLVLDHFAEARGAVYLQWLDAQPKVPVLALLANG